MFNKNRPVFVFGTPEPGALEQAQTVARQADYTALMGDNHKGYNMPIGGVAAYKDHVSPAGVGFDIGCGNKAVRLDITMDAVQDRLPAIAQEIACTISFGIGRKNDERVDHDLFDSKEWNDISFLKKSGGLKDKAREQLGTVGAGNHYVDVFHDEQGNIWIGVHFGSRGLGHTIAAEYIKRTGANPNGNMDDPPALLEVGTADGDEYIAAMNLAGRYAYAGRDWVCQRVARIIGAQIVEEVHNHHNFAWRERHFGEDVWVVRKGATPAFPGQQSFVGSSMGENSVILRGVESEKSAQALYSTMHGAGRVMSRTEAAGKCKWEKGRKIRIGTGKIDWTAASRAVAERGTILIGGGADEAPGAYKRLSDVIDHHIGTIEVVHTLRPVIVAMAGDEFDPYKD